MNFFFNERKSQGKTSTRGRKKKEKSGYTKQAMRDKTRTTRWRKSKRKKEALGTLRRKDRSREWKIAGGITRTKHGNIVKIKCNQHSSLGNTPEAHRHFDKEIFFPFRNFPRNEIYKNIQL